MRTWLKKQILRLQDLCKHPDPDLDDLEWCAEVVRDAADRAAAVGNLAFYNEYRFVQALEVRDAVAALSSLLASLTTDDEYLTIEEAAPLVGCSVSGLRKIVDRKAIKYFQSVKGSPIMFRREWLDDYVERNTTSPPTPSRPNPYGL